MWHTFFFAHAVCLVCRPWRSCWKKADIITAAMHPEIDAEVGRTKVTGNSKEVDELESLVSRMSVGAKGGDVHEDISLALGGLGLLPGEKPHAGSLDSPWSILYWSAVSSQLTMHSGSYFAIVSRTLRSASVMASSSTLPAWPCRFLDLRPSRPTNFFAHPSEAVKPSSR